MLSVKPCCSRDKARREESWIRLEKALQRRRTRVSGVIFGRVKGGFTVDLDGAVAFLPGSQVDVRPMRDVGPLMNQPQLFQILKMDRRRGNIVVSRRAVLEETPRRGTHLARRLALPERPGASKASSRTSPTTARSSISAASMVSCTSPTSPGGACRIRPKC